MFGTEAHTEKLLRHGQALQELQHKEGNRPQTTHLMVEILLVRGAVTWLALEGVRRSSQRSDIELGFLA